MSKLFAEDDHAYMLVPEQQAVVRLLAKASHDLCNGTGIVSWELGGKVANLCPCVIKNGESMEHRLEELEDVLKGQINAIRRGEEA